MTEADGKVLIECWQAAWRRIKATVLQVWQQVRKSLDWLADFLGFADEEALPLTAKERAAERWGHPPRVIRSRSAMLDKRPVRPRARGSI